MSEYVYPATDFDRPKNMLALLGTFWAEVYQGKEQITSITAAKGQVENQTLTDLLAVADSFARGRCPIYHTDNWYLLRLRQSELNSAQVAVATFDSGLVFNAGASFDVPARSTTFAFPVDGRLANVRQILNRFTEPSLLWTAGVDFLLSPGCITFRSNPFDDPRVARRHVYEDGQIVDEEAVLWLFKGEFDFDILYRQYGYVLNMQFESSLAYRNLLNAFFDALVGGTTASQVLLAASAITGIPLVLEPQETVEHVTSDGAGQLIITDQHVYRFSMAANPLVEVGDVVHAGDSLVNALEVYELNQGHVPENLRALAMGKGFLAACYYGDLVFENKDVPLEVIENHPSSFTYVKFGLGGFPLDVARFFDDMHERGIAASQQQVDACHPGDTVLIPGDPCADEPFPDQRIRRGTLAHLLDVRPNPVGEPTAASLPRTINPLQFLIENVLRANAVILHVRAAGLGYDRLGLHASTHFQRIVPPHTALILLVELTPASDSVTVELIDENLTIFKGMSLADTIEDMVVERIGLRVVSGTCQ